MNPEQAKVCCIMPTRGCPEPAALRALMVAAGNAGAPLDTPNRAPRDFARNMAVRQFLNSQAEWLLFVDDDTVIPPDTIERLLAVDKPIIAAVQPLMLEGYLVANVMPLPTTADPVPYWTPWLKWKPDADPFLIRYCGFGCVLIHRRVFEDCGWPWFHEDPGDELGRNNVTEDVYFCRKARRAKFQVWCHPGVVCGHIKRVDLRDVYPRQSIRNVSENQPVRYLDIPGWLPREAEELFDRAGRAVRPDGTLVTLGVFMGRSFCCLAEWLGVHGKFKARLLGVDHFAGSVEHVGTHNLEEQCRQHLQRANIETPELWIGDSAEAAERCDDASIDFVYVDASHDFGSVARDIRAWLPKLRPGGLMAGDDYAPEFFGVMRAVDSIFENRAHVNGRTWAIVPDVPTCNPWNNELGGLGSPPKDDLLGTSARHFETAEQSAPAEPVPA